MRYFAICLLVVLTLGLVKNVSHSTKGPDDYHYSFYSQASFFDNAYAKVPSETKPAEPPPKGLVVNHHLLASQLIAQSFKTAEGIKGAPVVILLSPNHFDSGRGQIITDISDWQTPYGVLKTDQRLIKELSETGLVNIDPRPFTKEHGISGIVPFIKRSLPHATVVPLIFKDTLSPTKTTEFVEYLASHLPKNYLIVASVDMSHYTAEDISVVQDQETIKNLSDGDVASIAKAHTDSPAAMTVILSLMNKADTHFHLLARSSSAILAKVTDPLDNTSYIDGYWQ